MVTAESPASRIGHITLGRKRAGKPIAGNRHDGFEVAGTGNQLTVWLVRHSRRKRGATDGPNLRSPAPVLDPTSGLLDLKRGASIRSRNRSDLIPVNPTFKGSSTHKLLHPWEFVLKRDGGIIYIAQR